MHAKARLAVRYPLSQRPSAPPERLYLGGPTSMPGFSERGVGGQQGERAVGGDVLTAASAHLTFPIREAPFGLLQASSFAHVGSLVPWMSGNGVLAQLDALVRHPRISAGCGLHLSTSGLVAHLTYAVPLLHHPQDRLSALQFGLSMELI